MSFSTTAFTAAHEIAASIVAALVSPLLLEANVTGAAAIVLGDRPAAAELELAGCRS